MTKSLARKLFRALLEEIRRNGLTDIFAFAILPGSRESVNFSEAKDYRYQSTATEISALSGMADKGNPNESLSILLWAALSYFNSAASIPASFDERMRQLGIREFPVTINAGDEKVDLNRILQQPNVQKTISLLEFTRKHQEMPDRIFMERMDEFLNQL